jgi:hypothetical protein
MDTEPEAIIRIGDGLREIYVKIMGKEPDPEVVRAEAKALVTRYGPTASIEEMLA